MSRAPADLPPRSTEAGGGIEMPAPAARGRRSASFWPRLVSNDIHKGVSHAYRHGHRPVMALAVTDAMVEFIREYDIR